MKGITPFLWFDTQAEEAVDYYLSIFPSGKKGKVVRAGGKVLTVEFSLQGQEFVALNGGPIYKFTEAVSFVANCETQDEVDHLWDRLSAEGMKVECGWIKDKYGLSWQIVPTALVKLLSDPNPAKAGAVMQAMLEMKKIVVKDLQEAYDKA